MKINGLDPIVNEAAVFQRDVPLVVGYGGGVNSLAALILLRNRGHKIDLITFANTGGEKSEGGEKPETYRYIDDHFIPWLRRAGLPDLVTVYNRSPQAGYESLYDDCWQKETMPSRAFGMSSCAMRWKIEPQDRFLNHWQPAKDAWARGKKPIKVLGYDGGENSRAMVQVDTKLIYWYPLLEMGIDRDACKALILAEGLPLPPKSACYYCPSSTKQEVVQLSIKHPDLFASAVAMEQRALSSERHQLRNIKGLGRHWSWKELVEADAKERAAMIETPVESCTICIDGSDDEAA